MKVIIDRFEGNFAVCEMENRSRINLEKDKLPRGAIEGAVLNIDGNTIFVDKEDTERRKEMSKKLLEGLFQ